MIVSDTRCILIAVLIEILCSKFANQYPLPYAFQASYFMVRMGAEFPLAFANTDGRGRAGDMSGRDDIPIFTGALYQVVIH